MRKSGFTEKRIAAVLAEARAGAKTTDLCRKHENSGKTSYAWRAKYGDLKATEVRRRKEMDL